MVSVKAMLPAARSRLVTVREDAPLAEAARFLDGRHINLVVVCDENGVMVGIVTRTDVVRQMSICNGCGCKAAVAAAMSKDIISCRPEDLLLDVWSIMQKRGLLHVPIIDKDSKPLGVINERDALRVLFEERSHEESLLRDYITGNGYR